MSSKDHREQKLLLFLSKNQDYVTSDDLAQLLHTSKKTIYRLIKKINDESLDNSLIVSEKGRGYKLNYEKFINYQKSTKKYKEDEFSPEERRKRVMEELLLSSPKPLKIHQLFSSYYVGVDVKSNFTLFAHFLFTLLLKIFAAGFSSGGFLHSPRHG